MKLARLSHFNSLRRYALVRYTRLFRGIDPDKVVFCCFNGTAYGDNPRCISERLHVLRPGTKIVWLLTDGAAQRLKPILPDYITIATYRSDAAYRALATARVLVDNATQDRYLTLSEGRQFYVQTWHGDRAIKKICYDLNMPGDGRRLEERCARVLTGSTFGEKLYRTAFRYKGAYIKAGSPRNDILVRGDPDRARAVRASLGVPGNTRLLLYAPTYREKGDVIPRAARMDMERTLNRLEQKTGGKWMCLFRAHYLSAGIDLQAVQGRVVDATSYPDMADLLLIADMVVTDYSSCALDFIVMDRPALFYMPDWQAYAADRGVYFDAPESPLMTAADQTGLEALIDGLTPEGVLANCAAIREYFGYYETGRATDAACEYIIGRLGSKDRMGD